MPVANPPAPFQGITTVPLVIEALEGFVGWCETNSSRLGYFAALYLRITEAVEAAIEQGNVFHNNALLAQLDVTFANRYLAALNAYFHPADFPPISACWLRAFMRRGCGARSVQGGLRPDQCPAR
jgi:hypothetical protein